MINIINGQLNVDEDEATCEATKEPLVTTL